MSGTVCFGENVRIAAGVKLSCAEGATLQIGKNSSINVNSQVICMEHIALGENVMLSWDDLVMDSDFHPIREDRKSTRLNSSHRSQSRMPSSA